MSKEKWALITGASSGIGTAFALELAKSKTNLILVARNKSALDRIAKELQEAKGIECLTFSLDLSDLEAAQKLKSFVEQKKLFVEMLINNAGFGGYGTLHETNYEENQKQMILNIVSLTNLTQLFLEPMVKNKKGSIINIASTASFQPVPYMAIYAASKAYVRFFTEALYGEYQKKGIRFLSVSPGPVETNFFTVVNAKEASVGKRDTPENTAREALRALERGKMSVITGPWGNFILSQISRFLPRSLSIRITEKVMRPRLT